MSTGSDNVVSRNNARNPQLILLWVFIFATLGAFGIGGFIYLWAPHQGISIVEFALQSLVHLGLGIGGIVCFAIESILFIKYIKSKQPRGASQ